MAECAFPRHRRRRAEAHATRGGGGQAELIALLGSFQFSSSWLGLSRPPEGPFTPLGTGLPRAAVAFLAQSEARRPLGVKAVLAAV